MGLWESVNTKESWWERKTGREYGFEDFTAKVRRGHRECTDTSEEEDLPSASRGRGLSGSQLRAMDRQKAIDRRAIEKSIKVYENQLKQAKQRLAAAENGAKQVRNQRNPKATTQAKREVQDRKRDVDEVEKLLKKWQDLKKKAS